jgi:RsiW-degrading membrane proteinase PrsW (M82 family)
MSGIRHPMTWVLVAAFLAGAVAFVPLFARGALVDPITGMISIALWNAYAVLVWWLVRHLTRDRPRPLGATWLAFAWGVVVVPGLGTLASPAAASLATNLLPADADPAWSSAIAAAVVEEPLKMVGVIAIVVLPMARFRSVLDGIYYGVFVGLGFEIAESMLYSFTAGADSGGSILVLVQLLLLRGVVGGLWNHPTFTAITGAGVGYFFASPRPAWRRWVVMLALLLVAMGLHVFFDSPLLETSVVVGTILKGIPVLLTLVVIWWLARREAATAPLKSAPVPAERTQA